MICKAACEEVKIARKKQFSNYFTWIIIEINIKMKVRWALWRSLVQAPSQHMDKLVFRSKCSELGFVWSAEILQGWRTVLVTASQDVFPMPDTSKMKKFSLTSHQSFSQCNMFSCFSVHLSWLIFFFCIGEQGVGRGWAG